MTMKKTDPDLMPQKNVIKKITIECTQYFGSFQKPEKLGE